MGHLYEEAVRHLPQAADGVTLDPSKPLGICETCRISSAPEQISRRTPPRATKPFEWVYFDLIQMEEGYNGNK